MSVAYEPRNFMHEGTYPSLGDESDQRFTESDVAEQLSHYTNEAAILPDDQDVLGDGRDLMGQDGLGDGPRLDLDETFPSPGPTSLPAQSISGHHDHHSLGSNEPSPSGPTSPLGLKSKPILKPTREITKQADGKFHCPLSDCKEEIRAFARKCEWNKHMDKHERPYRCPAEGCEILPGFTYSGGLLRHEREVHGKHGGPKNTVNCPHPTCKRHTGKGFSRQENLNEHLRRVHTNPESTFTPPADSPSGNESDHKTGMKRKRHSTDSLDGDRPNAEELMELRDEIKRVRQENETLRKEVEQQNQHSLSMMAQITDLQDALRNGLSQHALGAPTAQMI